MGIGEILGLIGLGITLIGGFIRLSQKIENNKSIAEANKAEIANLKQSNKEQKEQNVKIINGITKIETAFNLQLQHTTEGINEIKQRLNKYDENIENFWKDYNIIKK